MSELRVLTWHVHGSYLLYLAHAPHRFVVPVKRGRPQGYGGRSPGFPWPDNLVEVDASNVRDTALDAVLFQSRENFLEDQYDILSEEQRALPRLYVEHDPPREHPTDTRHPVDDPQVLLVHVTAFNDLMWDSGRTPTRVIDHGVSVPLDTGYTGELERGLVVVNNLGSRGRRVGRDVFERVREQIPLDLVGMGSKELGGLGEVRHHELAAFSGRYRFFFNPIRYTSLGLAVCEAMLLGMPIVGLATTEMTTAVENGVSGYVDTNIDALVERMKELLDDPESARRLGAGARARAEARFSIERFAADWDRVLREAVERAPADGNLVAA